MNESQGLVDSAIESEQLRIGPLILRRLFDFINHQNVDLRLG